MTNQRAIFYDEASIDSAAILRAIDVSTGLQLDEIGERLCVPRGDAISVPRPQTIETDESYRKRLVIAVCSCRGAVHVLGPDPSTWHHCQCGKTPGLEWLAQRASTTAFDTVSRRCRFCGRDRTRNNVTEYQAHLWNGEREMMDTFFACMTGNCPALAHAYCKGELRKYESRQRKRENPSYQDGGNPLADDGVWSSTPKYWSDMVPIKTSYVAIVDNPPNQECKIRIEPLWPPTDKGDAVRRAQADFTAKVEDIGVSITVDPTMNLDEVANYLALAEETEGVALRELLERDQQRKREDQSSLPLSCGFTSAQRAAVSAYHSAQLRAKIAASEAAAKLTIMVDRDLDEVE